MYAALRMFYGFLYVYLWILRTYTAFAYVCVRLLCTLCSFYVHIRLAFVHVVRILRPYTAFVRVEWLLCPYTAYLLRTLCGFCVHIRRNFTVFNLDSLKGSHLAG